MIILQMIGALVFRLTYETHLFDGTYLQTKSCFFSKNDSVLLQVVYYINFYAPS